MKGASSVAPRPRADRVAAIMVVTIGVVMGVLMLRVTQLQMRPGAQLREHVQARVTRTSLPPTRGSITDRIGRYLATSEIGYRAFVDPTEFPDPPDEAIERLATALEIPADELGKAILTKIAENRTRVAPRPTEPQKERKPGLHEVLSRLAAAVRAEPPDAAFKPDDDESEAPIRYVRVSEVLDEGSLDALHKLRIPGVHLEQRGVREYPGQGLAASIVGKLADDKKWSLGTERSHDKELMGSVGKLQYTRDAQGHPVWMSPGSFAPAKGGDDIRLSIDLEMQRIATEELWRGVRDADSAGGRVVVMDPRSGEILAMVDLVRPVPDAVPFPWADALPGGRGKKNSALLYEPTDSGPHERYITLKPDLGRLVHPALARNRCVEDVYEPGSTFKPFVWSTITELGRAKPTEVFDTEGGHWRTSYGRPIRDVVKRQTMTWTEVLINSSNIGMSKGGERLSFDQLCDAVHRFGFGSRTSIGLQGETAGLVTPRKLWSKYTQTSVSFGHEIAVTPVQMVRAFSVFARSRELAGTLPDARLTAADEGTPPMLHRVLRPDIAMMTRTILHEVAAAMEAKMASNKEHPETGWRYAIFGKSGTAEIPLGKAPPGKRRPPGNKGYFDRQYNSSFIAGGPLEEPRLVVLVVIDDPGPERVRMGTYYGAHVAGPVVRRIMERSLSYLGVPPSPAAPREMPAGAPMAD